MSRPPADVRWTIPADLGEVSPLVVEAAGFLRRHGLADGPLFTAQLALEEIVTNAVRHAGGDEDERASRKVAVHLTLDAEAVWIVIEDQGRPFDPLADAPVPDLTSPLAERVPGGLGLFLVRAMVHDLGYEREGATNRVRMRLGGTAAA